ncbi:hypothetical protein HDV05_004182 [Chytridiales sp. JEL 0842]|nr:hypothetical protein HDV05_004182 [Chytridiales sp. JEL 0842]
MHILRLITSTLVAASCASRFFVHAGPAGPKVKPETKIVDKQEYADLQIKSQYALLTYCADYDTFLPYTCSICNDNTSALSERRVIASADWKMNGFVGVNRHSKIIYFGFQGAQFLENWIYSALFRRVPLDLPIADPAVRKRILSSNAWVHDGFLDSYMSFRDDIIGNLTLTIRNHPTYELHGVGHSFGAPLITLAAADLVLNNVIPACQVSITTFGSPRIGNYEFAKLINKELGLRKVRRVVHSMDAIVHYPPVPTGYRHHGEEYWLDLDTRQVYKCVDDVPKENTRGGFDESPSCSNGVVPLKWSTGSHTSYFDSGKVDVCLKSDTPVAVQYMPFYIKKG